MANPAHGDAATVVSAEGTVTLLVGRLVLAFFLLGNVPTVATAAGQSACTFVLGFATLHDLIPDVVGDCVDDETHNPLNGDGLQITTGGLLVWRKSDNWTAFTDGSQSWINGPLGLQQRANDERLWWEANPDGLPVVPTPVPGERCHTSGLTLALDGVDAGAGNLVGTFLFTNTLAQACSFFGYPGALLLDATGSPLPTTVVRGGGYFSNQPPPSRVDVGPSGSAIFYIHWEQVEVDDEPTCSMADSLAITPPDEYVPLTVAVQIRACGGGHLDVSTVQPDPGTAGHSFAAPNPVRSQLCLSSGRAAELVPPVTAISRRAARAQAAASLLLKACME